MDIRVTDLAELMKRGEPLVLLDVREPDERSFCKIDATAPSTDLHVPVSEVAGRLKEIHAAGSNGRVVVYCHHGVRSEMVAAWLGAKGLPDVSNLAGGIDQWSRAVDRTVPRY